MQHYTNAHGRNATLFVGPLKILKITFAKHILGKSIWLNFSYFSCIDGTAIFIDLSKNIKKFFFIKCSDYADFCCSNNFYLASGRFRFHSWLWEAASEKDSIWKTPIIPQKKFFCFLFHWKSDKCPNSKLSSWKLWWKNYP